MMIFCDFDDTLFDKYAMIEAYKRVCLSHGIDEQQVMRIFAHFSSSNPELIQIFTSSKFTEVAKQLYDIDKRVLLRDLDELFREQASTWLFSDTETFLKKYNRDSLAIITFGDKDFQQQKISTSGIEKYFCLCRITDKEKAPIIQNTIIQNNLQGPYFFLDDKPEHFINVKKLPMDVITILVDHHEQEKKVTPNQGCDYIAKSLIEASSIIDQKTEISYPQ